VTPVPFDLAVRSTEASHIANLIFDHAENRPLTEEVRHRLAARAAAAGHENLTPYFGSLERDPVHPSTYYLAVDGVGGVPLLLHITYSTAPSSGLYPKSILVGRMRRVNGPEIVVNYVPFGAGDYENVHRFATRLDGAFLPRPQATRPAITVGTRHPEIGLPAAFDAYRAILKRTGLNLASTPQVSPSAPGSEPVSIRHLYHTGLWAAIRAGWREGYTAEAGPIRVRGRTPAEVAGSVEAAKESIHQAAGFTRFSVHAADLFHPEADPRHPHAWSDAAVEEKFDSLFDAEERAWILDEFARALPVGDQTCEFDLPEVLRLAVKFGPGLRRNEQIYEYIRGTRSALKAGRSFDFEPVLGEDAMLTTPRELAFYLQWLKARGCAAQLVSPSLGLARAALDELGTRLKELAAVARHYQCILSVDSGGHTSAGLLEVIGKSTVGKVNYKISEEVDARIAEVPAGANREAQSQCARYIDWVAENLIA
jgi:hypothetical protein